jgi:O-antigen/teichoic acid export membrane protein/SAM-dependent methyltransferase
MSELARTVAAPLANLRLAGNTMIAAVFASLYLIGAARVLGPREYADLAVCLSLSYVALLFLGPLNLTLIRFSSAYRTSQDAAQIRPLLRRTGRLYAPWVVGAIVVSILFETPIAAALHIESAALVPWTGVLVGLGLALGAVRAIALGTNDHRSYSGSVLVDSVLRVAAGGVLILIYRTAGAALAGFLFSSAVAVVIFGALAWRRLPASQPEWTESSDVLQFMAYALIFSAIVAGLHNVDMIVAKMRLDADAAGDYAVALAIARGFILVAAPFAGVALAGTTAEVQGGYWARRIQAPVTSYAVLSAAAVVLLWIAPAGILTLLFGRYTPAQAQLVPLLALAFAIAGAFLVLAQGEIRAGRFAFLVPVAVTLAAEVAILSLVPPTAAAVAWIVAGAHAVTVGCLLATPWLLARFRRFEGSAKFWDDRYAAGGDSGAGSFGKFGEFKAEILNGFVRRHAVQTVIEFGCGDGRQLALADYPRYVGFDVSPRAVNLCRERFRGDPSKTFYEVREYSDHHADLTLSLDVIYHLVEDEVFDSYMRRLFDASTRWVIVYASNQEDTDRSEAAHVRHRKFTRWVEANRPEWILRETIPNRYPYTGDFRLGSFSEFFIFERA